MTAPVVRMVRQALVPDAGEEHVSEVIFSDLVVQLVDDLWKAAPDDELYDFRPGVREELLGALGVTKIESVARRMGEFLSSTRGSEFDFSAVLDERGEADPDQDGARRRPFASVSRALYAVTRYKPAAPAVRSPASSTSKAAGNVEPVAAPGPLAVENGFWILVDGTDRFDLSSEELARAQSLGAELARGGFSLITLGLPGVAHAVARAFWGVLETEGYSSGIYRLLHVIPRGDNADYSKGRSIFPGHGRSLVEDVLARADYVVRIGSSRYSNDLVEAAQAMRVHADAADTQGVTPADLVVALRAHFAIQEDPESDRIGPLIIDAARALDERDLGACNRRLRGLARSLLDTRDLPLERLLSDRRRPSHRVLGHVAAQGEMSPEVLLTTCRAEQRTITRFWETRPLWYALQALNHPRRFSPFEQALAAVATSFARALDDSPEADVGGQSRAFLRQVSGRLPLWSRAKTLAGLAAEYERLRGDLPSGYDRTRRMHEIVDRVGEKAPAGRMEAEVWFESEHAGHRIVALGLLWGESDADGWQIANEAIARPLSPFEQYIALRVADRMIEQLATYPLEQLGASIDLARGGPGATISRADPSRDLLSADLLDRIRRHLGIEDPRSHRAMALQVLREGKPRRGSPGQLLQEMAVSTHPGVFVVGGSGHRTSEVPQQCRALNLVYALLSEGVLKPGGRIAVLGAGMSGLAAAAAASFHRCEVTLLERENGLLSRLARNRTRWLHPHAETWPSPQWQQDSAGVPLLDWRADLAANVATQVLSRWKNLQAVESASDSRIEAHYGVRESSILQQGGPSVQWDGKRERFDAVILALGQGKDRQSPLELAGYWDDDAIEREDPKGGVDRYLVSGNGYAGITDLLRVRLKRPGYEDLAHAIDQLPGAEALGRRLLELERLSDPEQYSAAHLSLEVSPTVDEWLRSALRRDTDALVTGMQEYPIQRDVPPLGRLIFARLLGMGAVRYECAVVAKLEPGQTGRYYVELASASDRVPQWFDRVLIRWGARSSLERWFSNIARGYRPAHRDAELAHIPSWPFGTFGPENSQR